MTHLAPVIHAEHNGTTVHAQIHGGGKIHGNVYSGVIIHAPVHGGAIILNRYIVVLLYMHIHVGVLLPSQILYLTGIWWCYCTCTGMQWCYYT
jgi:hypothetical protein